MAAETLTLASKIQNTFESLDAEKDLITTCTRQFINLSDHFSSLSKTLDSISKALDSRIEALNSETKDSILSLDLKESEIPNMELKDSESIELKKDSIIKEMGEGFDVNGDVLRLCCRRMDGGSLWRHVSEERCDIDALRNAYLECVDCCRLVVDAIDDFLRSVEEEDVSEKCWVIGVLVRGLVALEVKVSSGIKERAEKVASEWRICESEGEGGGGEEGEVFLRIVGCFGLYEMFEEEELRKLVLENASREGMAEVAKGLGFGEKMEGIIDELVKAGKEIEAVCFACECGLTDKFPPLPLIKSYLNNSRRKAHQILKNGNNSAAATDESKKLELAYTRSIIKCVENYNLESKFNIGNLKKRLSSIEKSRVERKKGTPGVTKSRNKRSRGGNHNRRPPKAMKIANAAYPYSRPPARQAYNYFGRTSYAAASNQSHYPR